MPKEDEVYVDRVGDVVFFKVVKSGREIGYRDGKPVGDITLDPKQGYWACRFDTRPIPNSRWMDIKAARELIAAEDRVRV